MGVRPKFSGNWQKANDPRGNFIHDKGFWKLLIDRRMYDRNKQFQDLTPVDAGGFEPHMVDPKWTGSQFTVTQVADDAGVERIRDAVIKTESTRTEGGMPTVDYSLSMEDAVRDYRRARGAEETAEEAEGGGAMFMSTEEGPGEEDGDIFAMAERIADRYHEREGDGVRFMMGDGAGTFKERQKRAVAEKGVVMPGLNSAEVKVVDVPKHTYTGNIAEATRQAIDAAKAKYAPNGKARTLNYNNHGTKFDYSISGHAIGIVLSPKHQGKSFNKGVHLALAEHLDRVIGESIEVEEHPDRLKTDGERDNNNINPDALMHRFYGIARIDGTDYIVMTLMKEEVRSNKSNGIHSYEVQKIEVLNDETPSTSNGVDTPNSELEGYPLAKIMQNVGKTMEPDKLLLEESAKEDRKREIQNTQNGSGGGRANFMVSEERDADYMDAVEKGDAEKAGRMVRDAARRAMPETKVVDENGEPRVMYHGTNLTRVNGSMPFWVFNEDSHFGTREQASDAFGRSLRRKELSKIYSVYLSIRNPKRVDDVRVGSQRC